MLHIVNKSPALSTTLQSCLRLARPGHALLLIEDAIYAATQAGAATSGLTAALTQLKVYALQPDVEARGMAGKLVAGVAAIDYAGFVDLVAEHPNNQSWL
jgi:tRNA 2-thiouridine synthesizing protein B